MPTAPSSPRAARGRSHRLTYGLWLLALVVIALLWANKHLGYAFIPTEWFAPLSAAMATGWAVVAPMLRRRERWRIGYRHARYVRQVLSPGVLAPLSLLLLVAISTRSSITIVGEAKGAVIYPVDAPARKKGVDFADGRAMFRAAATTPFGRAYRVQVKGYAPTTVTLLPLFARTLELGDDITPIPAVLFRPPYEAIEPLESGGRMVIKHAGRTLANVTGPAALLLGEKQPLPPSLRQDWNIEVLDRSDSEKRKALLAWRNYSSVPLDTVLISDAELVAEVWTRANVLVARAVIRLGREQFRDVPLVPMVPEVFSDSPLPKTGAATGPGTVGDTGDIRNIPMDTTTTSPSISENP
jgi:hypothetical protein